MSDESDSESFSRRRYKRKVRYLDDEDSSSESSIEATLRTKRSRASLYNYIEDSDTESDTSVEAYAKKKRVGRVNSDTPSSSSSSVLRRHRPPRALSENGSEDGGFGGSSASEWESYASADERAVPTTTTNDAGAASDFSDDQAEKCPICLLTFREQEVGTPESCDHTFCAVCIQEWSKNSNTCPVDRQPFTLILIRDVLNGRVVRRSHVEPPPPQNLKDEPPDDPTYCEVCGLSDREDTLLLCDGCDLGFHLECLEPPLEEVPADAWYCERCSGRGWRPAGMQEVGRAERRGGALRLVPRTQQTERVRQRIARQRHDNHAEENHSFSSGIEDSNQAGPSGSTLALATSSSASRRKPATRRKKKKRKAPTYRTVYRADSTTGEIVAVREKTKRRRKSRRKKKQLRVIEAQRKTVKRRLASQLGICPPRTSTQLLPEVRASSAQGGGISSQWHQAGIPTLHLFGRQDELDYFSDSDVENHESGLLVHRRPTRSDAEVLRRRARRKMVSLPPSVLPSGEDLLGTILESQTRLHSKNATLSLNVDGSLKVDTGKSFAPCDNHVNINDNTASYRQRPLYPNNAPGNNSRSVVANPLDGRRSSGYHEFIMANAIGSSSGVIRSTSGNSEFEGPRDYLQNPVCSSYDGDEKQKKEKGNKNEEHKDFGSVTGENTPKSTMSVNSDSELDIYSDIETVSTSKVDEQDLKPVTPVPVATIGTATDDENNDSDAELVIDTEKIDSDKYDPSAPLDSEESSKEETVSSTVDAGCVTSSNRAVFAAAHSTTEIQSERVQSTSQTKLDKSVEKLTEEDDDMSEDGCPNFSIYSTESINLAKTTDLELLSESSQIEAAANQPECSEVSSTPADVPDVVLAETNEVSESKEADAALSFEEKPLSPSKASDDHPKKSKNSNNLYSDSEDDIKIDLPKSFGIGDIQNMTEDISEEERSYTPCLDEKTKEGLDGLDTEMISDEDRNDFDESHELKTASDGDALEINAKDSELDFTKPEDYEEGEIVDKLKKKQEEEIKISEEQKISEPEVKKTAKEKPTADKSKQSEGQNKEQSSFKKLSKSNKERNYRDKDKERSRSRSKGKKEKSSKSSRKEKKKEKRKEIQRYNVRSIIADKPRKLKDKFGRDVKRSVSLSSRSPSPYRSPSRSRRSVSRERLRRRHSKSRERRSFSRSKSLEFRRSRSPERRRSRSRNKRRKRSSSYEGDRSRKKSKGRMRKRKSHSRSLSPRRHRDWERKRSRDWTPSLSRSPELPKRISPSWTPPRVIEQPVKPRNLTVILTNDSNKKKKEKKKKSEKKAKEGEKSKKKKRVDRTPPPSKEVFASGDNILVSVSFNKDNDTRDVTTKRKRDLAENSVKKVKKVKTTPRRKRVSRDLTGVKPVAIIDLDRSPFKEITPSPKDIIVLSDSENGDTNEQTTIQKAVCDSSQHVASPERAGPKTPPEPQVKFSLTAKPPQMRPIMNPLHEPDEPEGEQEVQEPPTEVVHKGPNTPPEPPNSPPSSPDAYDPFDPTKSRSPTPEPAQTEKVQPSNTMTDDSRSDSRLEMMPAEMIEKAKTPTGQTTPDIFKSHTPPLLENQPDSQSSVLTSTPDRVKSPDISPVVQTQNSVFPMITTKPVASTVPYSSSAQSVITSTPVSSNLSAPRINILSSTVLTPPPHVVSSLPQRIVLPNTIKSSPVKPPIKPTPIKPMPTKSMNKSKGTVRKSGSSRSQNDNSDVINLDFDSPYSPGSSDYEDLFEPPPDTSVKPPGSNIKQKPAKSPVKPQSAFDSLFGTSPMYKTKPKSDKSSKYSKKTPGTPLKGTKQIGVKLDEDNLKILDELPNSAVEMQVKDKFLKKLNRQERVVEEVKLVLKPHYNKKHINKEEYKDILRRAVPKICHNKSGEINPKKIQNLIEAYVRKVRHNKKVSSSNSANAQKV